MPTNKKAPAKKTNTRYSTKAKPKSRTGSSSLARSSKSSLFTKRNGFIAAGLAAIAGLAFVALGFASGTPDYQYSLSEKCSTGPIATTNSTTPSARPADKSQSCKDLSAEGMVYRLYKGMLGRPAPDPGGYQYWTQKLAGDRVYTSDVIRQMGGSKLTAGTDEVFLTSLYQNMFGRAADPRGKNWWLNRMKDKKNWPRERVVSHFVMSNEAKKRNEVGFNTFLSIAPTVKVVQTARADQLKRLQEMKNYTKVAQASAANAKRAENAAKTALSSAKSSASKSKPGMNDLRAMQVNQRTATDQAARARSAARTAKTAKEKAGRLKLRADSLANYATDIGADTVVGKRRFADVFSLIKAYDKNANSSAAKASQFNKDIAAQYKIAEKKYQAEQARQARIASCRYGVQDYAKGTCKPKPVTQQPAGGDDDSADPVVGQGGDDDLPAVATPTATCNSTQSPISEPRSMYLRCKYANSFLTESGAFKGTLCPSGYNSNISKETKQGIPKKYWFTLTCTR